MNESDQVKRCAFAIVEDAFINRKPLEEYEIIVLHALLLVTGIKLQKCELDEATREALRPLFEDERTSFVLDK